MTIEAQVCPRCGASIQFGEARTEVTCPHCGTTVVKTAPLQPADDEDEDDPEETSPAQEKEEADWQQVQEMRTLQFRLEAEGHLATGKIITAQTTDIVQDSPKGQVVLMLFTLEVQPDNAPAYTAESKTLVFLSHVAQCQPGALLNLRYDPKDRAQVSIYGLKETHNPSTGFWQGLFGK